MGMLDKLASILPNHTKIIRVGDEQYAVFLTSINKSGKIVDKHEKNMIVLLFWASFVIMLMVDFYFVVEEMGGIASILVLVCWGLVNCFVHYVVTRGKVTFKER